MDKEKSGFVCFDLETTGFGKEAEIIEFGAVKVIDGNVAEEFDELVKPEQPIPPRITKLTGITNEDVENCRSISEVLPEFLDFVDGYILVGHNIGAFDIPIVRRIAKENLDRDFNVYYVDTMRMARNIKNLEDCKLQTLLDHYGLTNENAHRAFQDCKANVKLLKVMRDDGIKADVKYSCAKEKFDDPWAEIDDEDKVTLEIEICEDEFSDVQNYNIVLTGEFEAGSRADVKAALQKAGAHIFEHVSNKIDYLIIGACGSDEWKFANGGSKILKAQKLNITILSETAVSKILKSNMEEMQNV
ncbi:MAG: exonuclease domain-containing protein [Oscillospiraceae bacterium]|nr:exonuclease domain-containing protein [Oscillospiraceae bacterium]